MEELVLLNRRSFLKKAAITGTITALAPTSLLQAADREIKISILHTNDVHSQIEPFAMNGSRYQGLGGVARRSTLINSIRLKTKNVLLLDAGDIFQGTPYFNLFEGKIELELMSKLRYDVGTFGNHEFDNGIDGILKHFDKANFPFVTSNYDFTATKLAGKTKDYVIQEKDGIRIGIFGLCKDLVGLVDPKAFEGMIYQDPITIANRIVPILREQEKCDLVICLSHLGYSYEDKKVVSDLLVASQTKGIDLIIGGHTHTLLPKPTEVQNLDNDITLVNQVGYGGAYLGQVDFIFNKRKKTKKIIATTHGIDQSYDKMMLS